MAERKMRKEVSPKKLNQILKKYKGEEGVLIPILQETQAAYGYLPPSLLEYMSEELHISLSRIYGIVTFYTQFRLKPWGRNIIKVCHGTACHVSGAEEISRALSDELKIEEGETTSDLKFTLMSVRCVGCCSLAPVMMINERAYGRLTPQATRKVIKSDEWEVRRQKAEDREVSRCQGVIPAKAGTRSQGMECNNHVVANRLH